MSAQESSEGQGEVRLRPIRESDLDTFFAHRQDPEANYMAAFTGANPADENAFTIKWAKVLGATTYVKRTILYDGRIAGHIVRFEQFGEPEVSYWLGREFWGKGIATRALALFLEIVSERPIFARAAKDNVASIRVLEKNGFEIVGEGQAFSNARGVDVEEYILKLDAPEDDTVDHP